MPNWCETTVHVSKEGNIEQFEKLCKLLDGPDPFNAIFPMPDFDTIPNDKGEFSTEILHRDDNGEVDCAYWQFPDGEPDNRRTHWCDNNWGTKWDMCNKDSHIREDSADFIFSTAWGPPVGIYEKIYENFPNIKMHWYFNEPNMEFEGYLQ